MAIDFVGFTLDHRVTGQIPLADDRLSDMLNSVARIVVRAAVSEEIDTGRVDPGDLTMPCGELLVVVGSGRRGVESQRRKTLTRRVRVGLNRYSVDGLLHVPRSAHTASLGGKPDELLVGRDLLVPLTDATVSYERGRNRVEERWETVLINRARVSWIEAADETPELGADRPEDASARLLRSRSAKDFTGTPSH
jgi:hypothetical protein